VKVAAETKMNSTNETAKNKKEASEKEKVNAK